MENSYSHKLLIKKDIGMSYKLLLHLSVTKVVLNEKRLSASTFDRRRTMKRCFPLVQFL